jgi:4-amino-4-deoxy-L-arabinose transferase-like glycosyltransferase
MTNLRRHLPTLALVGLLALFGVRLLDSARVHSLTTDEPHYIATGLYLWESGDYDFVEALRFHPPLAFHLASLPLLAFDGEERARWEPKPGMGAELIARGPPLSERIRFASRLPFVALALWGAFLSFAWAREIAGDGAGLLAAFLFSFSPMLLAHGSIVHSDITISVLTLQSLYALWRWLARPTPVRLLLTGLSLGLAAIAKLTSIVIFAGVGGLFLLLLLRWPRTLPTRGEEALPARAKSLVLDGAGLLGLVLLVIWLGYGGSLALIESPFGYFSGVRLPSWVQSFLIVDHANRISRPVYFLGEFSDQGWASFFPIAFAIKEPVGALALVGAALVSGRWLRSGLAAFLAPIFVVYLGVVIPWVDVPLGLRYVLPLFPLLFVLVATLLVPLAKRWQQVGVGAACVWIAIASLVAHPHYLSYFNELVGGPSKGHRYLLDANLDWGQDLGFLAESLAERGNPTVWLAYTGVERPADYGIRSRPLNGCAPVSGWIAISVNARMGLYAAHDPFATPKRDCYAWLDAHTPIDVPGHSILLYEIP